MGSADLVMVNSGVAVTVTTTSFESVGSSSSSVVACAVFLISVVFWLKVPSIVTLNVIWTVCPAWTSPRSNVIVPPLSPHEPFGVEQLS